MKKRKSGHSTFDILAAAAQGYRLVWRHWQYMAVTGLVPFAVGAITTMAAFQTAEQQSLMSQFLWGLPSSMVSGWFMFLVMRLAVFGERVDRLPQDIPFLLHRARLLRISIVIWLLINMGCAMIVTYLVWAGGQMDPANAANSILMIPNMALIALSLWGVRLMILHFLAAVDYPIKLFIFRVNGIGISFRLIALAILCYFPAALVQQAILQGFDIDLRDVTKLSSTAQATAAVVTSIISIMMTALMTASVADALRQQLGSRRHKKKTAA